ncbi:MAG: nucleotidyltransferase domain-containing protein [Leptospirales bacterium]|nr:nucleotidyltransferase domain-containing protein [Leptospirales bacterium]
MVSESIYEIAEIKRRLEPVFRENGVKSAILFGSYAKGEATENSDIDILVDSGLRGLDFVGLIEYIHNALQKNVDVIDKHYVNEDSPIDREVHLTGIYIYGG